MADTLRFRQAEATDLEAMVAMLADDPLGKKRERASDTIAVAYLKAFDAIQSDPAHQLWLAFLGQEAAIAGLLQLSFIPGLTYQGGLRAQVEGVRVRSDCRGQGIGAALLRHAIEQARLRGCVLVQLTSDRRRPQALAFYESLGFSASHTGFKLLIE